MAIRRFIGKPVIVEGVKWTGANLDEIKQFCNGLAHMSNGFLQVETMHGTRRVIPGEWVLKGTQGEFYPVRPEVMEAKYQLLEE